MKMTELFRFTEGPSLVYTQTSAAYEIVYNAETYEPHAIGRSQVESKNEMQRANVELKLALDNPVAARYLASPVDMVVTLTIFRQDGATTATYWKGRLASVKATGAEVTLTFESLFTSMRRPGLRKRYQKSCPYALYGRGCGLDPENFRFETTAIAVDGAAVTVSSVGGAADGRFRGGMLRGPDGVVRFVVAHSGNVLTLSREYPVLTAAVEETGYGNSYGEEYGGVGVVLYWGCAHNPTACLEFDNLDNYGGFPWIPTKNPMGGSSLM